MAAQYLKCPCGNVLGEVVGDVLHSRHRGREWTVVITDAHVVRCEACGERNSVQLLLRRLAPERRGVPGPIVECAPA